ncbi:D-2-hydroxyacid dehydrogenase [Ferrimonas balearica]|uniref:D-2-hydroxyacid dehydrogenase n=1 Tax=Ferrimonas balearica TaxID=44012 RepID=UPI001C997116|nr:D-2-hydroxyacid dehydrogenase [Ferrimonas balearica]MBY5993011.1 D-2-hydroxyacid dehydrogenase [Ferrimonas balearica]
MKLVVLDGASLNPGDLDWSPLATLGQWHCHEHTTPEQVVERAQGAEVLFTNKVVLDRATLAALPSLKYIGVLATGVNVVDLAAAAERGILVTNAPAYGPESVAQMAIAHLLHHSSAVAEHHQAVAEGQWCRATQFCFWNRPLMALAGKRFGVMGFGAIGQAAARMARGFNMEVLVHTRTPIAELPQGYRWVDQATLFSEADVVSLHCPQTEANTGFVDAALLATMKPSALLINTARGGLVNEADLADALNRGVIAGAGLDVLSTEPPSPDNPLLSAKHCVITPHNAWATREARQNLLDIVVANLHAYLAGDPVNRVN